MIRILSHRMIVRSTDSRAWAVARQALRSLRLFLILFQLGIAPAGAATIIVDTDADDLGAPNGTCSLREAVFAANLNAATDACGAGDAFTMDVIELPFALYTLTLPGIEDSNLVGDLDVLGDLTILGTGSLPSIIRGDVDDRVLEVRPGFALVLENVEVQKGSTGIGGSILASVATSLVLRDSRIWLGAASTSGGGLFAEGQLFVERTTFRGSSSLGTGGGVTCSSCRGTIDSSTFLDHTSALGGGALYVEGTGSLVVTNSTFFDNATFKNGGAILLAGGTLRLRNVTVARNAADSESNGTGRGGGTYAGAATSLEMRNTIVANNTDEGLDPDCSGPVTSDGYVLIGTNSSGCFLGGDLTGVQLDVDPLLGTRTFAGGTTELLPLEVGSPAIDMGSPGGNSACEALDQRGTARPIDGDGDGTAVCDMGAYEADKANDKGIFTDGFESGDTTI